MMRPEIPQWVKYFWLPLVVALASSLVVFGAEKIFDKASGNGEEIELSYTIEWQVHIFSKYTNTENGYKATLIVENNTGTDITNQLIRHSIKIWNSGNIPLEDFSILVKFSDYDENFKIYAFDEETNPPYEFGDVEVQRPTSDSFRFTYELLNPGDSHHITFIANGTANKDIYAKSPGLVLKKVPIQQYTSDNAFRVQNLLLAIMSATISGVSMATLTLSRKRYLERKKKFFKSK